jgi:glucokinase
VATADALPADVDTAGPDRSRAVLALDVGGTKLAAGVVDEAGAVLSFVVSPTRTERGREQALDRLFELGRQAVSESGVGWERVQAVGIGCGGPLDAATGVLVAPLHLPDWRDVPIVALAAREYERPATLENDATAAAAGEYRYGAGRGRRNMVYLTLSTGVGGGVVVDGRLYRAAGGNGGELGHVTVDWHGRRCRGCGRRGCLEAYVSGTSIAERAHEALAARHRPSTLDALEDPTAEDVAAAARGGDRLARAIWDETVAALACGLTSIVNLFEPELVVIGGGVSRTGEQLLEPVRERVQAEMVRPTGDELEIVISPLGERVGVVGAAAIAFERIGSEALPTHG